MLAAPTPLPRFTAPSAAPLLHPSVRMESRAAVTKIVLAATILSLAVGVRAAGATPIVIAPFSGTGTSGSLASSGESWMINCSGTGPSAAPCPTGDFAWGSPGVGFGLKPYGESTPASDFEITFSGFDIDPSQIAVGLAEGCAGREGGGTVFCGGPTEFDVFPWTVVFNAATPNTIAFFAPAGVTLNQGQFYFTNIFLEGRTLPESISFTGAWTGGDAVPEPATLLLFGSGLVAVGSRLRQRRTKSNR